LRAAERWYANSVSKTTSGDGMPWGGVIGVLLGG
jgi:hypothetical protein